MILGVSLLLTLAAPQDLGRNGPPVRAAIAPVSQVAGDATVEVLVEGRVAAMGAVVRADGWVITKASELEGVVAPVVRFADGRELVAEQAGRQINFDLALLRVEAEGLTPIAWAPAPARVGQLVVSVDAGGAPLGLGMIGVGVEGAVVARVAEGTAAEAAGLAVGDRILEVQGEAVADRASAAGAIQRHQAGESVRLLVERAGKQLELEPVLAMRVGAGSAGARSRGVDGQQSALRAGFPAAFQHDTVVPPERCGGPLLDLTGAAIGLNIARAGRVATYAIPAAEVRAAIGAMIPTRDEVP